MRGKTFKEEQIIGVLKEAEAGMPLADLIRKHGICQGTFYRWKAKFGGMEGLDVYPVSNLRQAADFIAGQITLTPYRVNLEKVFEALPSMRRILPFDFAQDRPTSRASPSTVLRMKQSIPFDNAPSTWLRTGQARPSGWWKCPWPAGIISCSSGRLLTLPAERCDMISV